MEVRLGNKTYSVQEGWVSRWDLLSNYREDVGSNKMEIPSSSGITRQQMEKWMDLNIRMTIKSKKEEKIKLNEVIRPIQYFMPSSGKYLEQIDFTTQSPEQRVKLTRELGNWRRDLEVHLVALNVPIMAEDPYPQLKNLAKKLKEVDPVASERVEELAALARKIPIDFLYGLHTLARSDWRLMPWEDAYSAYDLLKDEWQSTSVAFLRYYIDNSEAIRKMKYDDYTRLTDIVARIPVLRPSNLVRIFVDRELLDPVEPGLTAMRLLIDSSTDTTDEEIIFYLKEYASNRVMPDLLNYQLTPVEVETVPEGRMVRDDYDVILPNELDAKFNAIRTPYAEIRPWIPDVEGYFARLYKYAEKHSDWKTFRVIFNGIALFERLLEATHEQSLSILPVLLDCVDPFTTYRVKNPMRLLVDRISQTLGSNCLTAMTACIIGAMEKESVIDYISMNMAEAVEEVELSPSSIASGRDYMLQFCNYAVEVIEEDEGSSEIKWPILKE